MCKKALTYSVHSVWTARRRQARWRLCTWSGLALLVVGVLGLIFLHGAGDAWIAISISAMVLGFVGICFFGMTAAEETGVTGHMNAWPGATKHAVTFIETRPADTPELICERCGHEENYPWGSHLREGFAQKRYQAAKIRFDEHECGPGAARAR